MTRCDADLAGFFELGLDVSCIIRTDGQFVRLNRAWEKVLGHPGEELEGRSFLGLVHPDDLESTLATIAGQADRRQVGESVGRLRHRDGRYLWIEWHWSPGEAGLLCGSGRDVTMHVRREARSSSLFDESPLARWVLDHSAVKGRLEELLASGVEDVEAFLEDHPEEYRHCIDLARVVGVNRAAVLLFEAADADELLCRFGELYPPGTTPGMHHFWAALLRGERSATFEEANQTLNGRRLDVLETVTVPPGHESTWDAVYSADVDITERRRAEAMLAKANRMLRTVSEVNQMMIRQTSAQTLVSEACRIFVEHGGFKAAWIGFRSQGNGVAVPVAAAGCDLSDAEALGVCHGDLLRGEGPIGAAFQSGRPVVWADLLTDPAAAACSAPARECGFRSMVTAPIPVGGRSEGALSVCAAGPAAFAPDEVSLLGELADDLGFALRALEDAAARKQSEAALRASEERYRTLVESTPDFIYAMDTQERYVAVNGALARAMRLAPEEILGKDNADLGFPAELVAEWRALHERVLDRGEVVEAETTMPMPDGSTCTYEVVLSPIVDEAGAVTGIRSRNHDITGRKRAERRRREAEERQRCTLDRLRLTVESAVRTLARTIEMRDPYTAGHQERATELAVAIGERLGLHKRALTTLRTASLIHDLGKIALPAEILSKPGALTEIEWNLVRLHPETAHEILREMRFPGPVAAIVRQHHERLDGSGYPRGLVRDEIRLEARILAVADVVEAMASHRPYRAGLGIDAALGFVRENKGTQFDGDVVDACILLFEEGFGFSEIRP